MGSISSRSVPPSITEPLKFACRTAASKGGLSSFPGQPCSASFVPVYNKQTNCRALGLVDVWESSLGNYSGSDGVNLPLEIRAYACKVTGKLGYVYTSQVTRTVHISVGIMFGGGAMTTRCCEMLMVRANGVSSVEVLCPAWPNRHSRRVSSCPSTPSSMMFIRSALWWLRVMQKTISWKQSSEIISLAEAWSGSSPLLDLNWAFPATVGSKRRSPLPPFFWIRRTRWPRIS